VLKAVRLLVLVAVVIAIGDAWQLLGIADWLVTARGQVFLGELAAVAVILAVGGLIYLVMASWVEFRLNPAVGAVPTAREVTLLSLLRNAFTILLCVIIAMMVLAQLGVNIGPLIAGAGVLGLAISFGAQSFVQDVITGIFIQFENAMNTGDVVNVAGIGGVVEKLTIRSVSIRALDGTLHIIPFSSVGPVSNSTKHFGYHVAEVGVAYRENVAEVKAAMQDAFDRLMQDPAQAAVILGDFDMQGIIAFADSAVVVRGRIRTMAGKQWGVGRAYNELVKQVFDERGIEIPFPHMTLYWGEDKQGMAPPLHVVSAKAPSTASS
jgi:small-conductance mechanosensitive channel